MKYAIEIRGSHGEAAGVQCPNCAMRQYPYGKENDVIQCSACEEEFKLPPGYYRVPEKPRGTVLRALLKPEHIEAGLDFIGDDHNVSLTKDGKVLANCTWPATGVLLSEIQRELDQQMNWSRSGVSFGSITKDDNYSYPGRDIRTRDNEKINWDEAIEELQAELNTMEEGELTKWVNALQLGIEALARCKVLEENSPLWAAFPLLGETASQIKEEK